MSVKSFLSRGPVSRRALAGRGRDAWTGSKQKKWKSRGEVSRRKKKEAVRDVGCTQVGGAEGGAKNPQMFARYSDEGGNQGGLRVRKPGEVRHLKKWERPQETHKSVATKSGIREKG